MIITAVRVIALTSKLKYYPVGDDFLLTACLTVCFHKHLIRHKWLTSATSCTLMTNHIRFLF